jgi:quercetin dioxygenase-like cupin family protein
MQMRRFSADLKTRIPGGHRELYGVPIQLDAAQLPTTDEEALARRFNGRPIVLNRPTLVVAIYLEAGAAMQEHSADVPVLCLVLRGRGHVRIGGPAGETSVVRAGDAVLWPAHLDHTIWTEEGESLDAILVHGPAERI